MNEINPFYPVLRQALSTTFVNEHDEEIHVPVERDALLNGVNGSVLGVVGNVYKLVTNQEVEDVFRAAFADLPIEEVHDHLNWKQNRWQRDYILNGDDFNITVGGDVVQTKISIFNGYDGKSAIGFSVSAYRRHNNMTLLSRMFGKNYSHVHGDLIERIRSDFASELQKFQNMTSLFQQWERQSFNRETFEMFVRGHIKTEERGNNGYLSERQAEAIIDSYELHLSRCGVRATRWGAYNILASIAEHDFQGRGGSSNVFTAGYGRMARLSKDFFEFEGEADLFVMD